MDLRGKGNTADFGVHKKKVWDTKEKRRRNLDTKTLCNQKLMFYFQSFAKQAATHI